MWTEWLCSVYNAAMIAPPQPLCAVAWTPDLAGALAAASAAIARLDARICASSLRPAWSLRASWAGYAAALRLQQLPLEEIDIIAAHCGLRLPGRETAPSSDDPHAAYAPWLAELAEAEGRHWREHLPFPFDPPQGWTQAPALIRALDLLDHWARAERTILPWLAFPTIMRRMEITSRPLPCLVAGDPGQRFAQGTRPALLKRLLKQLARQAEDGLARLERLEDTVRRGTCAIAGQHRPGKLADLGRVALSRPCLAARSIAPQLALTISGAGKLLERARRLGLLVETSGRGTWRSYVTPDIALSAGLVTPDRGRPRQPPPPSPALTGVVAAFDAEIAAIDARLARLGSGQTASSAQDVECIEE
jgi:hypothetical protein